MSYITCINLTLFILFIFRLFAAKMPRPFSVRYNPFTQSLDVLESKDDLTRFGKDLQTELGSFMNALDRMQ